MWEGGKTKERVKRSTKVKRVCFNCDKEFEMNMVRWKMRPQKIFRKGAIAVASFCSLRCETEFMKNHPETEIASIETNVKLDELERR